MSGVSALSASYAAPPPASYAALPPASYISSPMAPSMGGASHYQMSGVGIIWPDSMSQHEPPALMSK